MQNMDLKIESTETALLPGGNARPRVTVSERWLAVETAECW